MEMKINETLFVLDTETGGLDPNSASIMEIAGVILKEGKKVYEYSSIVKSPDGNYNCNEFARKMHGITDEMANTQGKYPIQIMNDLKKIRDTFFNGSPMTIVAHNAFFDISFVKKMFIDNGSKLSSVESQDDYNYDKIFSRNAIDTATMALILRLQGKLPFDRCSLDNILKFYEIEIPKGDRHSALADATQTAAAFKLMFNDLSHNKESFKNNDLSKNKTKNYDEDFDDSTKITQYGGCERT